MEMSSCDPTSRGTKETVDAGNSAFDRHSLEMARQDCNLSDMALAIVPFARRLSRIDFEMQMGFSDRGKLRLERSTHGKVGYDLWRGGVRSIRLIVGGRSMHDAREAGHDYPVKLSILQRRLIAGLAPEFSDRLKLSEQNQRVITFDVPEWTIIRRKIEAATNPQCL